MDAFKLLSRATTLQKAHAQHKQAEPHLPSAGTSAQPAILANSDAPTHTDIVAKGKKRKRGKDGADRKYADSKSGAKEAKSDTLDDLEERRRTLKKHKLKITSMESHEDSKNRSTSKGTKAKDKDKKHKALIYPRPLTAFGDLQGRYHVSPRLVDNLSDQGFYTPTEVQMAALPMLLGSAADAGLDTPGKGQQSALQPDLLTVAPTGSGKTLAFLIPVVQKLLDAQHVHESKDRSKERVVKAVVLAPTHELVDQIVNEGKKLCTGTGIKVAPMRKGSHIAQASSNIPASDKAIIKADILISTPMMIVNELKIQAETQPYKLDSVLFLVLDEADVLLDPLFRDQTTAIWAACTHAELRVSLWSATIGASIETKAQDFITNRRRKVGAKRRHPILRLIVGLKDSSLPTISHRMTYAATEQGKLLALRELLHPSTATALSEASPLRPPFLVFTQTIQRAKALFSELLYDIPVEAGGSDRIAVLHSELSEQVRSDIMSGFRKGEIWIIITTDLLARGVDFRGVNGIVNYDIPNTGAAYVHRAGRTGRGGREGGVAVTLYTKEDIPYVTNIANVISASEKAHGQNDGAQKSNIDKWLLDALPKVSKKARNELKRKGVAARRTTQKDADTPREARRTRIGTTSGYDRKLQHRRQGAREGQLRNARLDDEHDSEDGGEWEGLDD